jgi:hypothetical protein
MKGGKSKGRGSHFRWRRVSTMIDIERTAEGLFAL